MRRSSDQSDADLGGPRGVDRSHYFRCGANVKAGAFRSSSSSRTPSSSRDKPSPGGSSADRGRTEDCRSGPGPAGTQRVLEDLRVALAAAAHGTVTARRSIVRPRIVTDRVVRRRLAISGASRRSIVHRCLVDFRPCVRSISSMSGRRARNSMMIPTAAAIVPQFAGGPIARCSPVVRSDGACHRSVPQ